MIIHCGDRRPPNVRVPPITTTLCQVAARCVESVPRAGGCGINLLTTDGRRITSVATDSVSEQLIALHDRYPDNPGMSAWLGRNVIRADAPDESDGYGSWSTRAGQLGVRSVLAAALATGDRLLGTITVYSVEPGAFFGVDEWQLATFAGEAASASCSRPTSGRVTPVSSAPRSGASTRPCRPDRPRNSHDRPSATVWSAGSACGTACLARTAMSPPPITSAMPP